MKIPFEEPRRRALADLLEQVFDSNFLSEGETVRRFEAEFADFTGTGGAVALTNGGMGLLALLEYVGVQGREVVVPTNTFMATPLAVERAGGRVVWADCRRDDLCVGLEEIERRVTPQTAAVIIVHIGGHLAFDSYAIADFCRERGIALLEDCAHAHGASYRGKAAGTFGLGGAYSFYATKTMPTGEGGMVVSDDPDLLKWIGTWRNYGKFEYRIKGFNARMNEVTAALGLVQLRYLPEVLAWKRELAAKFDQVFENRVRLPRDMESGFYKYIVFDTPLTEETGMVFGELCHEIMGSPERLPGAEWIKEHHRCAPIWYGWEHAEKSPAEIREILLRD